MQQSQEHKETADPLVHRLTHLVLGRCEFENLADDAGVTVKLDGPCAINYAPGLFFMGSPHIEAAYWHARSMCSKRIFRSAPSAPEFPISPDWPR